MRGGSPTVTDPAAVRPARPAAAAPRARSPGLRHRPGPAVPPCALAVCALVAVGTRGVGAALASAWNPAAGTGLAVLDVANAGGAVYFNGSGRLTPTRSYAKTEASAYVEYGLTERLMFVARPSFDLVSLGDPAGGTYRGFGGASVGAQYQALVYGPAVVAVQGSVALPGTGSRADPAEIGNTAREADLRALAGLSFPLGPYPAFLDVQQAYRLRSGGAAAQWHSDVTVGFRPIPRLLVMALSAVVVPTGPGTPWLPSARSAKLGIEVAYDLSAAWSLTLRASTTVYGRDALRERGLAAGLWYRF